MWIGIFPHCEYGQLNCPKSTHETLTLCNVFQLTLSEGCTLTTPSATLFSNSDQGITELNMTKLGLPQFLTKFNDTILFTHIPEIQNIHINPDAIHDSIRTLDSIACEASLLESQYRIQHNSHVVWDTLKASLISIFVILLLYFCIRFKVHKCIQCLFRPCAHYYSRCMVTNTVAAEQITFTAHDFEQEGSAPTEGILIDYPAQPMVAHPNLKRHPSAPSSAHCNTTSQRTTFGAL
jgi:hypothetical protein